MTARDPYLRLASELAMPLEAAEELWRFLRVGLSTEALAGRRPDRNVPGVGPVLERLQAIGEKGAAHFLGRVPQTPIGLPQQDNGARGTSDWISTTTASKRLGMSRRWWTELAGQGIDGPLVSQLGPNGRWLISEASARRYIAARKGEAE